jgi:hypothetical protein
MWMRGVKPKLIAASLNTVRVLRGSGAQLDAEQEKNVKKFEAVVAAYEEMQRCGQGANG